MTSHAALFTIAGKTEFDQDIESRLGQPLAGLSIDTVQVNIGLRCNLACRHCHVESSPNRREEMTWQTMLDVLRAAELAEVKTLDITGGAPEMHPRFCDFIDKALSQDLEVMVRTNLTVMLMSGYTHLPQWYAERGVHLVASLPCYLPNNVDQQRGRHVFAESVEVVQRLNQAGYAQDADKPLDLVYNPLGPTLPPAQKPLEDAYRKALAEEYGLAFNQLYTITNIPIGRYLDDLAKQGKADAYMRLLVDSFNPATIEGLMCRHQLHVGWDGRMYDCDFNFAINLPAQAGAEHVRDFDPDDYRNRQIVTGNHCYACTAGAGSSCGGSLVDADESV